MKLPMTGISLTTIQRIVYHVERPKPTRGTNHCDSGGCSPPPIREIGPEVPRPGKPSVEFKQKPGGPTPLETAPEWYKNRRFKLQASSLNPPPPPTSPGRARRVRGMGDLRYLRPDHTG